MILTLIALLPNYQQPLQQKFKKLNIKNIYLFIFESLWVLGLGGNALIAFT